MRSKILKKLKWIYSLYRSGERKEALRELVKGGIKFDKRCNRGERLFSFITRPTKACLIEGGIVVLFVEKIIEKANYAFGWHWVIPVWFWVVALPLFYVFQKALEYRGGRFDQKKLKSWQEELKWEAENVNPWEQRKMGLLEKINERTNESIKERNLKF